MLGEVLEMVMLVMFGLSWPLNLVKCFKARTARGTSLPFYISIEIGYIAGIVRKFLIDDVNFVLIFYFCNFLMVLGCVFIYFRNKALDNANKENN